ncbi:MAG: DUF1365 domain-containing protein [Hyphomonas sp.]|nr:DUF1365 domain-containing protein [Hyphomonas sp.]
MSDPAAFYVGQVSHRRFGTPGHFLRYRIAYLLLDLDRLADADRMTRVLKIGKGALMSFRARDHGDGHADDLAGWVRTLLLEHGIGDEAATIHLLTIPRMLGYVFNPISVYFIRDGQGRLHHVLYEVRNTFGERHFYLCAAVPDGGTFEQFSNKAFYVSPFFDTDGEYAFRLSPPDDVVALSITYREGNKTRLTAHLSGKARRVTTWSSLGILLRFPLMTFGVVAAIHWEAMKLWIKGARYRRHGPVTRTASVSHDCNLCLKERERSVS